MGTGYKKGKQQRGDNQGDIIIGNDVWIGYESVIMAGVTIGDGAIIGTRAIVTKDAAVYDRGRVPAKPIRRRFPDRLFPRYWNWNGGTGLQKRLRRI